MEKTIIKLLIVSLPLFGVVMGLGTGPQEISATPVTEDVPDPINKLYMKDGQIIECDIIWEGLDNEILCSKKLGMNSYSAGDVDLIKTFGEGVGIRIAKRYEKRVKNSITVTYTYGVPMGGYTEDNVIPSAQIQQSTNGDGIITIYFKIKDPTGDYCTLHTFQYSVDGGKTWHSPVNGDQSESLSQGWQNNNYSSAQDFNSAEEHSFTFHTQNQNVSGFLGKDQNDVLIRFTISDGTFDSELPLISEKFRVDNLAPNPPIITTNSGHDFSATDSSLTLEGKCAADTAAIYVNGSTLGVTYNKGETSWTYTGTLQTGDNTFIITAEDAAGNLSKSQ